MGPSTVRHKVALQRFLEDGKLRRDNNTTTDTAGAAVPDAVVTVVSPDGLTTTPRGFLGEGSCETWAEHGRPGAYADKATSADGSLSAAQTVAVANSTGDCPNIVTQKVTLALQS